MSSSPTGVRCAAALSRSENTSKAVADVCQEALAQLGGTPDLAMVFLSPPHVDETERVAAELCDRLGTEAVVGCTGESIIGNGVEVEGEAALSLWLAKLPGTTVETMHLRFVRTPEGSSFSGWPESLPAQWPAGASLFMLGEPFSFPADGLLERLNDDQPHVPVIGGMASGGSSPGENRLILGREAHDRGAVAMLLHGAVRVRTVVSQGCRPIGRPFVVTRAEQNVIHELGGKPALGQLRDMFPALSPREQQLIRSGLHVGRVTSEYKDQFASGDFLVRNVMGADQESGAIAIGDFVRTGQTVQFHVRDERTADEELQQLLADAQKNGSAPPAGALLFTCNGRGTRLFTEPHHDTSAVRQAWHDLPVAGFFAQGEIGPIGGRNFLHGFTASIALIG